MEWVQPFSAIGKDDAATAGGKGASLGEMTQAGIPVPPGFVVLAPAFERFVEGAGLAAKIDEILATVDPAQTQTVDAASKAIQELILKAAMPEDIRSSILQNYKTLNAEFVAVRSSATAEDGAAAAWAGQLDTYLNTTEENLTENVQRCWASLFTPRAVFYRFEKGLDKTHISVAVVVQKMVNADAAGVAFSVDPVTEDRNRLIIEGTYGLGEAVVSGQVTPDSYTVSRESREVVDMNIAEKDKGLFRKAGGGNEWRDIPAEEQSAQALSDRQLFALAGIILKVEAHYGFPVDMEWAREGGTLYILQSRPITTLRTS